MSPNKKPCNLLQLILLKKQSFLTNMKSQIKLILVGHLVEQWHRSTIPVTKVAKNGQPRNPVRSRWKRLKSELVTPSQERADFVC